jgi:hypothetical protein
MGGGGVTYPEAITRLHELAADGSPDVYTPDQYGSLFTTGGCALYATALVNAHREWRVVAAGWEECAEHDPEEPDLRPCGDYGNEVCGCMVGHFYAQSPDGTLHDIYATIRPICDETLTCVLESWHYGMGDDYDVAALALMLAG